MTDQNENKPISTFDEICHLTIETMRKMDMENLLQLKKQATREFDRAKLTKGCIELPAPRVVCIAGLTYTIPQTRHLGAAMGSSRF